MRGQIFGHIPARQVEKIQKKHGLTIFQFSWHQKRGHEFASGGVFGFLGELVGQIGILGPDDISPWIFGGAKKEVLER